MEDHHVDRPDVEARQRVKLTGTNRSSDLIALIAKARDRRSVIGDRKGSPLRSPFADRRSPSPVLLHFQVGGGQVQRPLSDPDAGSLDSVLRRPGGPCEAKKTRSHPELGRQTPQRRWYSVSRHGRVGRRQACQERKILLFTKANGDRRRAPALRRSPFPCRGVEQPGSSSGS